MTISKQRRIFYVIMAVIVCAAFLLCCLPAERKEASAESIAMPNTQMVAGETIGRYYNYTLTPLEVMTYAPQYGNYGLSSGIRVTPGLAYLAQSADAKLVGFSLLIENPYYMTTGYYVFDIEDEFSDELKATGSDSPYLKLNTNAWGYLAYINHFGVTVQPLSNVNLSRAVWNTVYTVTYDETSGWAVQFNISDAQTNNVFLSVNVRLGTSQFTLNSNRSLAVKPFQNNTFRIISATEYQGLSYPYQISKRQAWIDWDYSLSGYTMKELNDRYQQGLEDGEAQTKDYWYNQGKAEGYADGTKVTDQLGTSIREFMFSLFDAPLSTFTSVFNFEVMGFDVGGFVAFLLTAVIVAGVIKVLI